MKFLVEKVGEIKILVKLSFFIELSHKTKSKTPSITFYIIVENYMLHMHLKMYSP